MKTERLSGTLASICSGTSCENLSEDEKFGFLVRQQSYYKNFKEAINTLSDNSTLCMFGAIKGGYRIIINYLLDNGADPLLRQINSLEGLRKHSFNVVEYLLRICPKQIPGPLEIQGVYSQVKNNAERFEILEDIIAKVSARGQSDAIEIRRGIYHAIVKTREEFGGDTQAWSKYLGQAGGPEQDKEFENRFVRKGDAVEGENLMQTYIALQDRMRNELENEYKVGLVDEKPQTFFESVSSNMSYFASNLLGYNTQARDREDTVPLAKEFDSKAKSERQEEQPLLPRAQREAPIPAESKQQSKTGELRQRKATQNPEQNSF